MEYEWIPSTCTTIGQFPPIQSFKTLTHLGSSLSPINSQNPFRYEMSEQRAFICLCPARLVSTFPSIVNKISIQVHIFQRTNMLADAVSELLFSPIIRYFTYFVCAVLNTREHRIGVVEFCFSCIRHPLSQGKYYVRVTFAAHDHACRSSILNSQQRVCCHNGRKACYPCQNLDSHRYKHRIGGPC